MHKKSLIGVGLAALAVAACSNDTTSPATGFALTLASAYSSVPAGFSELSSTFAAGTANGPFEPGFDMGGGGGRGGDHGGFGGFGGPGHGPGFGLGFMGGGLGGAFFGDGIGHGFFHPDSACVFSTATGQVTCGPTTHDGITVTRVSKYTTAAGVAQAAIDSTTNTIVAATTVAGTTTRAHRDSGATIDSSTSTISEKSNQTVTGLAAGSTSRTVNGTSSGTESTTGTSSKGAYTASRTAGDTVTGVVVPTQTTANPHPYPTAGTVIRAMSATVTFAGQTPATSTRREVVTYDGSATATVVITVDGTTQNCTVALPHGALTCS